MEEDQARSEVAAEPWDPSEPTEVLATFRDMLAVVTGDGAAKRRSGSKPSWKVDTGHAAAMYRHLDCWEAGERHDRDSGAHPLVAVAWRALAVAWRETHDTPPPL